MRNTLLEESLSFLRPATIPFLPPGRPARATPHAELLSSEGREVLELLRVEAESFKMDVGSATFEALRYPPSARIVPAQQPTAATLLGSSGRNVSRAVNARVHVALTKPWREVCCQDRPLSAELIVRCATLCSRVSEFSATHHQPLSSSWEASVRRAPCEAAVQRRAVCEAMRRLCMMRSCEAARSRLRSCAEAVHEGVSVS